MKISDLQFKIAIAFLVDRKSHRWIEENLLQNTSSSNLGFGAKRELDKLGLDKKFKHFLADVKSEDALNDLLESEKELISKSKLESDDFRLIWIASQEVYLFQRVIINKDLWERPTAGRLGFNRDGEYLQDNGFGHEDWNFNTDLSIDGFVYGYRYGAPAKNKLHKKFNIAFCERWANGAWAIVGYYRHATFEPNGSPESSKIIEQKTSDLQLLRRSRSIGRKWDVDKSKMKSMLRQELSTLGWKVKTANVFPFSNPVEIPKEFDLPQNDRITTPTYISKELFELLIGLHQNEPVEYDDEKAFQEGKLKWAQHRKRERDPRVVNSAKELFLKKHNRFFCEACGFDFVKKYGEIGASFIEAHHTTPVSQYDEDGGETSVKDISLLCANCHRMIHRSPSLTLDAFKRTFKY